MSTATKKKPLGSPKAAQGHQGSLRPRSLARPPHAGPAAFSRARARDATRRSRAAQRTRTQRTRSHSMLRSAHCFLHHSEHKHFAHSAACSCTPARSRCAARPWPCRPACACARAGTACPQRCTREKARREQKCRRMACARVAIPASVKPACACVCEYALHIREHACMPGRAAREASTTRPRCF